MSKDNHYDEVTNVIQNHIVNKQYDEANKILDEELSMPYIPESFEKKFIEFKKTILIALGKKYAAEYVQINREDWEHMLLETRDPQDEIIIINQLIQSNLRKNLDLCRKYFLVEGAEFNKIELLKALNEQKVSEIFEINWYKNIRKIDPCKINWKNWNEIYDSTKKSITDFLEIDEPSIIPYSEIILKDYIFNNIFEEDFNKKVKEEKNIALLIIYLTKIWNGDDLKFKDFLQLHSLKEVELNYHIELLKKMKYWKNH